MYFLLYSSFLETTYISIFENRCICMFISKKMQKMHLVNGGNGKIDFDKW